MLTNKRKLCQIIFYIQNAICCCMENCNKHIFCRYIIVVKISRIYSLHLQILSLMAVGKLSNCLGNNHHNDTALYCLFILNILIIQVVINDKNLIKINSISVHSACILNTVIFNSLIENILRSIQNLIWTVTMIG